MFFQKLAVLTAVLYFFFCASFAQAVELRDTHKCTYLQHLSEDGSRLYKEKFGKHWTCGYVVVPKKPIDDKGTVSPQTDSVWIRYARYHKPGKPRNSVLAYAGGPGQGAVSFALQFKKALKPLLKNHDMLIFDQRGTGADTVSLDARCRSAKTGFDCRKILGENYKYYSSKATAVDTELLRKTFRIPKFSLYGVSYGTKNAWDYARFYPENVEKIVLDSPLAPNDGDPYMLSTIGAVDRVLQQICENGACPFTDSVSNDLKRLLAQMDKQGKIYGKVAFKKGQTRKYEFSQSTFLDMLVGTDFSPYERLQLPGIISAAAQGDKVPLLRFFGQKSHKHKQKNHNLKKAGVLVEQIVAPDISEVAYSLNLCNDQSMPWPKGSGSKTAKVGLQTAIKNISSKQIHGWSKKTIFDFNVFNNCIAFGGFGNDPVNLPKSPENVPILVLSGMDDLRTPNENALQYKQFGAQVLNVYHVGHSVLSFGTECVKQALQKFANNLRIEDCKKPKTTKASSAPYQNFRQIKAPKSLQVQTALLDTFYDFLDNYSFSSNKVAAGMRGGWFEVSKDEKTISFYNYRFYRDFAINGTLNKQLEGKLKVGKDTINVRVKGDDLILTGMAKGTKLKKISLNNYEKDVEKDLAKLVENYFPKATKR